MLTSGDMIPALSIGDWYTALVLKEACFHVAIKPAHSKYLQFCEASNHFHIILYGPSPAMIVLTKCLLAFPTQC